MFIGRNQPIRWEEVPLFRFYDSFPNVIKYNMQHILGVTKTENKIKSQ